MEIKLLSSTLKGEQLIAQAYGICTGKESIPIENIPKWIAKGHLSPIEHASATFKINGISRACSHQLVRHRLASYSQRSQRYCAEDEWEPILPDSIRDSVYNVDDIYRYCMAVIEQSYEDLVANGIPKEDARMVLSNAMPTEIIVTMNLRSWRHFIQVRNTPHAQWEIRKVAQKALQILSDIYPSVFNDLNIPS